MRVDKKTIVRVELTYADGSRFALRDDAARTWEKSSNACVLSAYAHGVKMQKLDWEQVPPGTEVEVSDLRVRMRAAFQLLSGAHKEVHQDCGICDALRFLSDGKAEAPIPDILPLDTYQTVRSLLTADGIGRCAKSEALLVLLRAVIIDPSLLDTVAVDVEKAVQ